MDLEKGLASGLTKGVADKVESGIAKAKGKIDSIGQQTKEQYQNWKRVLSGALNDKQLIIALAILFGFYLCFTGFNTILGGNSRDENTVTCICPVEHSAYYRTLVIVTIIVWVACFVLTLIWDAVKFWRYAISKRHHQTTWSPTNMDNQKDHASSMLGRTMDSVGAGIQAARKIPVQSMLNKTMDLVDNTLDVVDEGAKTLHNVDSRLKDVREKPLESVLKKSMESVDNVVMQRLGSTDENAGQEAKVSESPKPPTAAQSWLGKAAEIVSIAKEDPTLARVVNPLDEKAQEIIHGPTFGKSMELVKNGIQTMNQNPDELVVSKAMDFVDEKAQINSAELIAKSKQLTEKAMENPTDTLMAMSMNAVGNQVATELAQRNLDNEQPVPSSSMLSTATISKFVDTGMNAMHTDGQNSGLVTSIALCDDDDPAKSLLQRTMEVAKQNPAVIETTTSLNGESAAPLLLSTAMGMANNTMEQNPENAIATKALEFVEGGGEANQMLAKSVGLATSVFQSQDPVQSLVHNATELAQQNLDNEQPVPSNSVLSTATKFVDTGMQIMKQDPKDLVLPKQNEAASNIAQESISVATELLVNKNQMVGAKSLLSGAAKSVTFGQSKMKKRSRSKKSVPRELSDADSNALMRLKHYEDYLWLQFYKVYSVGATLQGEDQVLPAFVNVIVDDHEDSNENEGNVDDEVKPLIARKKSGKRVFPETELVEMQNSCGDIDDIPAVVIEADYSDENHVTEEDQNAVAEVSNESDISGEISDTINCYKNDDTDNHKISNLSTIKSNSPATVHHETNSLTTIQGSKNSTPVKVELSETTDHPLATGKLSQSNASLLSVKSNSAEKELEEDLLGSWLNLKPVGLYDEETDDDNLVEQVTNATCSRLVLVPLLLFQILDTYTWICITDDVYCSSVFNQYRLGLDKAALTFTFYCCLLTSILSTAILRWFPCSKVAGKAEATCLI